MQHSKTWDAAKPCYGKFWVDTAGERKRKTVNLGVCRTRTRARQLLQEYIDREGINDKQTFIANTAPATTFREQAERWISSLPTRRRKPVKPATVSGWRDALNAWILPNIGSKPLSEVSNGVVRDLVEKMAAAGLSPKTIVNYVHVVKRVVASAVNSEGEPIHPRSWNNDFIGLPVINKATQRRPTITSAEVEQVVSSAPLKYSVLFALLAGTGLRIGEALGIRVSDLSSDCRVLHVRQSVWRGKEQSPKTSSAVRQIDVPEALAAVLRSYVADNEGYIFATDKGRTTLTVPQRSPRASQGVASGRISHFPSLPHDVATEE